MKALEIKISVVFILVFTNSTNLSCFFFFFLITDLNFSIPAVIPQIFNPTAELASPTRTETNEQNVEIETEPLTAKTKTRKFSK